MTATPHETTNETARPNVASREAWLAARRALLEKEKAHTRRSDELARLRRELPWVRIEKAYRFETGEGEKTLAELFDGRSQLLVYHFMFGPEYEAGCPTCSSVADTINGIVPHLNARDVTMILASRAPIEKLQAYKQRMGWSVPWVSAYGGDFTFDFGTSFTEEQLQGDVEYNYRTENLTPLLDMDSGPFAELAASCGTDPAGYIQEGPGLSAFALEDGVVYHTYSTYARGAEFLLGFYPILDRAPLGRNEGNPPEMWIRRRDEYGR